jgi:hypothetical protein
VRALHQATPLKRSGLTEGTGLSGFIAALFILFTAITIPFLSQMEKVPLLFMGPLANVVLLIALVALGRFIGWHARRRSTPG